MRAGCRLTAMLIWVVLMGVSGCGRTGLWNISPSGRLRNDALVESSGVAASRQYADIFWTHNDSGNSPDLFAINSEGVLIARYQVPGSENLDWEDIALDENNTLYIWDNSSLRRPDQVSTLYVLPEPNPWRDQEVAVPRAVTVRFPDGAHDCEALLVREGTVYLISKSWDGALPRIYTMGLEGEGMARFRGEIPVHTLITGGDICPDGRQIVLSSYRALLLFEGDEEAASLLQKNPLISRLNARQVEAIACLGESLLLTNEQRDVFRLSLRELRENKAPFLSTPKQSVPFAKIPPSVAQSLNEWPEGRWLRVSTRQGRLRMGRVVWTEEAVHFGIELPPGMSLRTVRPPFARADYDDWFVAGGVFLLLNPDGKRPLAYGADDRCLLIGNTESGDTVAFAHSLRPGTLIEKSESMPTWTQVERQGQRVLLRLSLAAPGMQQTRTGKVIGFNLILVQEAGNLISWAPLTRRFTWDSPSIWGLLELAR